jgi:hypothetical protein
MPRKNRKLHPALVTQEALMRCRYSILPFSMAMSLSVALGRGADAECSLFILVSATIGYREISFNGVAERGADP